MAISTCVKCGGKEFEVITVNGVRNAVLNMRFVQCASCGGVIGVLEFDDNNMLIETLAHKLGVTLEVVPLGKRDPNGDAGPN